MYIFYMLSQSLSVFFPMFIAYNICVSIINIHRPLQASEKRVVQQQLKIKILRPLPWNTFKKSVQHIQSYWSHFILLPHASRLNELSTVLLPECVLNYKVNRFSLWNLFCILFQFYGCYFMSQYCYCFFFYAKVSRVFSQSKQKWKVWSQRNERDF